MDKVKQWKPGQLITIKGIVYRVTKINKNEIGHKKCAFYNKHDTEICHLLCRFVPHTRIIRLPFNCYLKKL